MRYLLAAALLLAACSRWNPNLPPQELACFEAGGGDECLSLNPATAPDMAPMPDLWMPADLAHSGECAPEGGPCQFSADCCQINTPQRQDIVACVGFVCVSQ